MTLKHIDQVEAAQFHSETIAGVFRDLHRHAAALNAAQAETTIDWVADDEQFAADDFVPSITFTVRLAPRT